MGILGGGDWENDAMAASSAGTEEAGDLAFLRLFDIKAF
jgi:hypothetical protein